MTTIQVWLLKLALVTAIIAGACIATWFAADAHYSRLAAQLEQANKDQAAEDAKVLTQYAQAAMEIDNEARTQIADQRIAIGDLSVRLNGAHSAIGICSASTATVNDEPIGSGSSNSPGQNQSTGSGSGSVVPAVASVDPQSFRDVLEIAKGAIKAEQLWRQHARETGAAK